MFLQLLLFSGKNDARRRNVGMNTPQDPRQAILALSHLASHGMFWWVHCGRRRTLSLATMHAVRSRSIGTFHAPGGVAAILGSDVVFLEKVRVCVALVQ